MKRWQVLTATGRTHYVHAASYSANNLVQRGVRFFNADKEVVADFSDMPEHIILQQNDK